MLPKFVHVLCLRNRIIPFESDVRKYLRVFFSKLIYMHTCALVFFSVLLLRVNYGAVECEKELTPIIHFKFLIIHII